MADTGAGDGTADGSTSGTPLAMRTALAMETPMALQTAPQTVPALAIRMAIPTVRPMTTNGSFDGNADGSSDGSSDGAVPMAQQPHPIHSFLRLVTLPPIRSTWSSKARSTWPGLGGRHHGDLHHPGRQIHRLRQWDLHCSHHRHPHRVWRHLKIR